MVKPLLVELVTSFADVDCVSLDDVSVALLVAVARLDGLKCPIGDVEITVALVDDLVYDPVQKVEHPIRSVQDSAALVDDSVEDSVAEVEDSLTSCARSAVA